MRSRITDGSVISQLLILGIILSSLSWSSTTPAQSEVKERPTLKDFGSSLKRLKWDPAKQAAIEIKESKTATASAEGLDAVRVQTDLVVFDVQIRDRQGQVVTGLTSKDFIVTEDGQQQAIAHFSLGSDLTVPRSIILVIDYSGSLAAYLDQSIDAAKVLVSKLGPKDRLAVVTDDVKLLVDFTADQKKLKKALESLRDKKRSHAYGHSFQLTALMAAVRELFDEEEIRPIVIFQTDGDEVGVLQPPDPRYFFMPELPANATPEFRKIFAAGSRQMRKDVESAIKPYSLNDVYKSVEKSRATIYTIVPGQQLVGVSSDQQYSIVRSLLPAPFSNEQAREIAPYFVRAQKAAVGAAMVSGGWTAFLNKPDQAADIYAEILSDINSRYLIGYYPTNKVHDGRRRSVLVAVRGHPDYIISGRQSYYSPEPEQ